MLMVTNGGRLEFSMPHSSAGQAAGHHRRRDVMPVRTSILPVKDSTRVMEVTLG